MINFKTIFIASLFCFHLFFSANPVFAHDPSYSRGRITGRGMSIDYDENYSKIVIENEGEDNLTSITVSKDEELVETISLLKSGESRVVSIPLISGIIHEDYPSAENTGWITIRNAQGDEEKFVYFYVDRHASKKYPWSDPFVLLSYFLVILSIAFILIKLARYRMKAISKK